MLIPELRKLIELFVETMMSESAHQMKKETWSYKHPCKLISYNSYKIFSEEKNGKLTTSTIDDQTQKLYGNPLYDYQATAPDQISLNQGKLITVLQKSEGWSGGIDENGKVGYFPTAYVQIVSTPSQYIVNSSTTSLAQQQEMAVEKVIEQDIIPFYAWLQNVTGYYLQEIFILFQMATKKTSLSKQAIEESFPEISVSHSLLSTYTYTPADICDLIDDVVSGLMKFLVNYFKLFEMSIMNKINTSSISQVQIENIITVIDDVKSIFLPSLLRVLENAFKGRMKKSNDFKPSVVMRIIGGKLEKIRLLLNCCLFKIKV